MNNVIINIAGSNRFRIDKSDVVEFLKFAGYFTVIWVAGKYLPIVNESLKDNTLWQMASPVIAYGIKKFIQDNRYNTVTQLGETNAVAEVNEKGV